MNCDFQDKHVRDLFWVLARPGILSSAVPELSDKIVDEAKLQAQALQRLSLLQDLDQNPSPLHAFLAGVESFGRLGRYFERLLEFGLREILQVTRLETNIPIQGPKRTLGELDLLVDMLDDRSAGTNVTEHWEASVKFYLCTAETKSEAVQTRFYLGTVVEDRFDLKLQSLLGRQLDLVATSEAQAVLASKGWDKPIHSRALLKGLFYYPSHLDWRATPLPKEISPSHPRGWWTTSGILEIPQHQPESLYLRLGLFHWLAEFHEPVDRSRLMTRSQLCDFIRDYFKGPVNPNYLRRRELTIAEVVLINVDGPATNTVLAREITRGHIVHSAWPELARAATGV